MVGKFACQTDEWFFITAGVHGFSAGGHGNLEKCRAILQPVRAAPASPHDSTVCPRSRSIFSKINDSECCLFVNQYHTESSAKDKLWWRQQFSRSHYPGLLGTTSDSRLFYPSFFSFYSPITLKFRPNNWAIAILMQQNSCIFEIFVYILNRVVFIYNFNNKLRKFNNGFQKLSAQLSLF